MTSTCPYCRAPFEPEEEVTSCPACSTPHHADCWTENRGCTVFGCTEAPVEEPKISVSNHDLSQPPGAPPQASGAQPPPPPPPSQRSPVPPPPRPTGTAPAPVMAPIQAIAQPVQRSISFAGYAPSATIQTPQGYVARKSRVAFVVLAIFFGAFGVHNFYAGYIKKAVIQCCLTVLTFFIASPVVWIWAIVEACTVNRDDDGVAFT